MNEMIKEFLFFGAAVSIMGYELGLFLKAKFRLPIFNPLLISIIAVMIFLSVFHIDYESYNVSARYLSYLLTPATVCLAVPLYQQLSLLKKHARAILAGTVTGVLTTMATVLVLALLFQLTHEQYVTFLPKSITTAIGMGVSEEMGGIVTITVACIIITGIDLFTTEESRQDEQLEKIQEIPLSELHPFKDRSIPPTTSAPIFNASSTSLSPPG